MTSPTYRRVLLKLSGEVLAEGAAEPFSDQRLRQYAADIQAAHAQGVQIAIVVGGGNLLRGRTVKTELIRARTADHMGMLATIMNGLALRDVLTHLGVPTSLFSAKAVSGIAAEFDPLHAEAALANGEVVVFAGGTGNPFVTTDSASSLRAIEVGADIVLKATNVDGVYAEDPKQNPHAVRYTVLSFADALSQRLAVMDMAAFSQCQAHDLPIRVFDIAQPCNLRAALLGEPCGTLVSNQPTEIV